jgi:hypothetical protein
MNNLLLDDVSEFGNMNRDIVPEQRIAAQFVNSTDLVEPEALILPEILIDQAQSTSAPFHTQHPSTRSPDDKTKGPGNVTSPATFTVPVLPINTHNVVTNKHIHSVQQFSEDLSAAVKAAWPTRHESRYSDVQVLILSWEDDDLGVSEEIEDLRRTFRDLFNYGVTEWRIPQHKPERKLNLEAGKFLEKHDSKDHLLIVYYAGHGCLNEQRIPMWAAYVFFFIVIHRSLGSLVIGGGIL